MDFILVFDGKNQPDLEIDPVSPISHYGEQKVEAEAEMRSCHPQATICRMPLMFGIAPPNTTSFIQPFIKTLRQCLLHINIYPMPLSFHIKSAIRIDRNPNYWQDY